MIGLLSGFRTIQGCPAFADIAPYIAIAVNDAHATVESIYRGDDARAILNAHGKHSQAQLYDLSLHGTPAQREAVGIPAGGGGVNLPGHSTHELFSDGIAFPQFRDGTRLPWWCQGFDVNGVQQAQDCIRAAAKYGWVLFEPYSRGSELHHLCFRARPARPRPGTALWARLWRLRITLPRH